MGASQGFSEFRRVRTLTLAPPDVSTSEHTGDAASGSLNHPERDRHTLSTGAPQLTRRSPPGPHAPRTRHPPYRAHAPRAPAPPHRARCIHTHPPVGATHPPPPPPSRAPHHTYTHLSGAHPHTSPGTEHTARAPRANTAAYTHTALVAPLHTHMSFDTAVHPPQPSCLIYEGSVTAPLARGVMRAAPEGSRPEAPRRPSADPTQARGATRERGTSASH